MNGSKAKLFAHILWTVSLWIPTRLIKTWATLYLKFAINSRPVPQLWCKVLGHLQRSYFARWHFSLLNYCLTFNFSFEQTRYALFSCILLHYLLFCVWLHQLLITGNKGCKTFHHLTCWNITRFCNFTFPIFLQDLRRYVSYNEAEKWTARFYFKILPQPLASMGRISTRKMIRTNVFTPIARPTLAYLPLSHTAKIELQALLPTSGTYTNLQH